MPTSPSHTQGHEEVSEDISAGGIPTRTAFGGTRSMFHQCRHFVTRSYIYMRLVS